jgi:hypothetical protein
MSWMLTAAGRQYHFTGSMSLVSAGRPVDINDIAHQLAMINRFHGATSRPYSVAEHSLLVAHIALLDGATHLVQLGALLHDAHEIYTNDLASPAKWAVNIAGRYGAAHAWRNFEGDHSTTVRDHFGLLTTFSQHGEAIKRYDLIALATERRDLTVWDASRHEPWAVLRDGQADAVQPLDDGTRLTSADWGWDWTVWRDKFSAKFYDLNRAQLREKLAQLGATPKPPESGPNTITPGVLK